MLLQTRCGSLLRKMFIDIQDFDYPFLLTNLKRSSPMCKAAPGWPILFMEDILHLLIL